MNRREFLQNGAAMGTVLNLKLASHAAANNMGTGTDRKTLVCVYFGGGLDAFHVLVPRDDARYADYRTSRDLIAHRQETLIPLTEKDGPSTPGALYGLHPNCQKLADLFNGENQFANNRSASWVSNVGTLIKPLTMDEFRNGTPGFDIPVGIGGHVRQREQWQTSQPQGTVNLKGWLGRTADLLRDGFNRDQSSMNLSLNGNNIMQLGEDARALAYNPFKNLGLSSTNRTSPENPLNIKNIIHQRILGQGYENFVDKTFADISSQSLERQLEVQDALDAFDDDDISVPFPTSVFGRQMAAIFKLISTRETQGLCRQTFFVPAPGGWDDHGELGDGFDERIEQFSEAIAAFQLNIDAAGLRDTVMGFTASEFARTLRSTGAGSDHAWGGPQMIFGGPIKP